MLNALAIHLLRDDVKEYIDIPFREYDSRAGIEEVEEIGHVKADRVIERKDSQCYL